GTPLPRREGRALPPTAQLLHGAQPGGPVQARPQPRSQPEQRIPSPGRGARGRRAMKALFDNRAFRALVLWCGLWQASHLALNVAYCLGSVEFPLPPPQGWTEQARLIFDGLVASDLVQSVVSLAFVVGYLLRKRWCFVLGLASLSSSAFNSFSFTYFIVA